MGLLVKVKLSKPAGSGLGLRAGRDGCLRASSVCESICGSLRVRAQRGCLWHQQILYISLCVCDGLLQELQ